MSHDHLRWRIVVFALVAIAFMILIPSMADEPGKGDQEWKAPARAARKKNPIAADDTSIATGQSVYAKECLSCHGPTGKGDGPAAKNLERPAGDLSSPKLSEETDGALFWKITEGRKPMASFEKTLTEEQRWHVINYVRTLAPKGSAK